MFEWGFQGKGKTHSGGTGAHLHCEEGCRTPFPTGLWQDRQIPRSTQGTQTLQPLGGGDPGSIPSPPPSIIQRHPGPVPALQRETL